MNNTILGYIEECEAWKVAIKNLHWSADNLSQHELCDDIASSISDFEDLVSEVEQSISGKIKLNGFTPKSYEIKSLKMFVEDVISSSKAFLNKLEKMGENYVGIKSECETFIGDMQRKLYLVNFTMKEELKRRIAERINESYRKEENIKTTFHGTKPSTEKGMLKRINDITKGGQLNTRTFTGLSDAYEFYKKTFARAAVGDLHCLGTFESNVIVQLDASNNMTYFGLMRAKEVGEGQYKASVTFSPHGDEVENPEPEISEPTIEDCDNYEIYGEGRIYRMTGNELHSLIKESVMKIIESDYQYNPMTLNGDSVRAQYAGQIEREENYKENLKRFKEAYRRIGMEYPGKKSMGGFLIYVKEVEGDTLYDKIWEKYGGEYDELADQYLQHCILSRKRKK